MKRNNHALCIFVKAPEVGKVKTRLAASLGNTAAANIYKKLVDITITQTKSDEYDTVLFVSGGEEYFQPYSLPMQTQNGDDLGDRMYNAIRKTLEDYEKVALIGSDCPQIDTKILLQAFDWLDQNDIVIGPSQDGGYYLIAMKKAQLSLFENMTWSTESVYNDTLDRINKSNLSYQILVTLNDIDDVEDWEQYQSLPE